MLRTNISLTCLTQDIVLMGMMRISSIFKFLFEGGLIVKINFSNPKMSQRHTCTSLKSKSLNYNKCKRLYWKTRFNIFMTYKWSNDICALKIDNIGMHTNDGIIEFLFVRLIKSYDVVQLGG